MILQMLIKISFNFLLKIPIFTLFSLFIWKISENLLEVLTKLNYYQKLSQS